MSWTEFHAVAEEIELWTTLAINSALIVAAVPTAIAIARSVRWERVVNVATVGGVVGFTAALLAFVVWVTLSPNPFAVPEQVQCVPSRAEIHKMLGRSESTADDDAIIRRVQSTAGGCIILGGTTGGGQ